MENLFIPYLPLLWKTAKKLVMYTINVMVLKVCWIMDACYMIHVRLVKEVVAPFLSIAFLEKRNVPKLKVILLSDF